ncbi:MAG TPA: tetratricopeptide repeat protein [Terracidiphilus sp.]|nr:tetratricopeptide repeat protein [Terracidiphilus sp.]
MCQVDEGRRFSAVLAAAMMVMCGPLVLFAQNTVREADNTSVPQPPVTNATPAIQATPEQIGDAFLAHQRYQEAIAEYKKESQPSATVWNKMGIAYEMMFDSSDAYRCFKKSLRLEPHSAQVLNNLGTVYDSRKKYKAAERLYRKATKLDPTSAIIQKNLGTNLLARRKYEAGWEAYRKALALDPHIFDQNENSAVQNTASLQERGAMNYYMAKSCVLAGLNDRAIQFLRLALTEGFTSPKKVAEDSSFKKLHNYPAFQELIAEHRPQ